MGQPVDGQTGAERGQGRRPESRKDETDCLRRDGRVVGPPPDEQQQRRHADAGGVAGRDARATPNGRGERRHDGGHHEPDPHEPCRGEADPADEERPGDDLDDRLAEQPQHVDPQDVGRRGGVRGGELTPLEQQLHHLSAEHEEERGGKHDDCADDPDVDLGAPLGLARGARCDVAGQDRERDDCEHQSQRRGQLTDLLCVVQMRDGARGQPRADEALDIHLGLAAEHVHRDRRKDPEAQQRAAQHDPARQRYPSPVGGQLHSQQHGGTRRAADGRGEHADPVVPEEHRSDDPEVEDQGHRSRRPEDQMRVQGGDEEPGQAEEHEARGDDPHRLHAEVGIGEAGCQHLHEPRCGHCDHRRDTHEHDREVRQDRRYHLVERPPRIGGQMVGIPIVRDRQCTCERGNEQERRQAFDEHRHGIGDRPGHQKRVCGSIGPEKRRDEQVTNDSEQRSEPDQESRHDGRSHYQAAAPTAGP